MIEVYWANTQDGKRRSVEFAEDDERIAQAFGTWLASTDGIVGESVRVALPEQRQPLVPTHLGRDPRVIVDEVPAGYRTTHEVAYEMAERPPRTVDEAAE